MIGRQNRGAMILGLMLGGISLLSVRAVDFPPVHYTLSVVAVDEARGEKAERVLVLSPAEVAYPVIGVFKTAGTLEKYIARLPKGSKVECWGQCVGENLSGEEFEAVTKACKQAGVTFVHYPAG